MIAQHILKDIDELLEFENSATLSIRNVALGTTVTYEGGVEKSQTADKLQFMPWFKKDA